MDEVDSPMGGMNRILERTINTLDGLASGGPCPDRQSLLVNLAKKRQVSSEYAETFVSLIACN
jgi:hypothetical protein